MEDIDRCIDDIDSFIAYEQNAQEPNCWGFLFTNGTSAIVFMNWIKNEARGFHLKLNIFQSKNQYNVQFIRDDDEEVIFLEYVNIKTGYIDTIKNYDFRLMGDILILPFCLVDGVVTIASDLEGNLASCLVTGNLIVM